MTAAYHVHIFVRVLTASFPPTEKNDTLQLSQFLVNPAKGQCMVLSMNLEHRDHICMYMCALIIRAGNRLD